MSSGASRLLARGYTEEQVNFIKNRPRGEEMVEGAGRQVGRILSREDVEPELAAPGAFRHGIGFGRSAARLAMSTVISRLLANGCSEEQARYIVDRPRGEEFAEAILDFEANRLPEIQSRLRAQTRKRSGTE